MVINRKFSLSVLFLVFSAFVLFPLIDAGPYGYGDSADLNYHVSDGKIVYGYGSDEVKYQTSLRPNDLNWSEWRKNSKDILKGNVVEKSWAEIFYEEEDKDIFGVNNFFSVLINKFTSPFFGSVEADNGFSEEVIIQNDNFGGCGIR